MLRRHMAWAKELADWIAADPDFELVTGPNLALLSFRWQPHGIENEAVLDGLNERLLHAINDDGRLYLTQNRLKGRYTIRVSVGGTWTERRHVEEAWALIREIAARLRP